MGRQTLVKWTSGLPPIDWTGTTVAIVASGPSALATDFALLRRLRVMAINCSWRLVPWAELLYGIDNQWWEQHKGVPEFGGRKMTSSPNAASKFKVDTAFCRGNNSGTRGIHIAAHLGAKRILLIGYDMHMRNGVHWHSPHQGFLHNPYAAQMRLWQQDLALQKFKAEVINCTPGSALTCFPTMELRDGFVSA